MPRAVPTASTAPDGSMSIVSVIRVRLSSIRWKSTAPALRSPVVDVHAMRWSGVCSVISASHSWRLPANPRLPPRSANEPRVSFQRTVAVPVLSTAA